MQIPEKSWLEDLTSGEHLQECRYLTEVLQYHWSKQRRWHFGQRVCQSTHFVGPCHRSRLREKSHANIGSEKVQVISRLQRGGTYSQGIRESFQERPNRRSTCQGHQGRDHPNTPSQSREDQETRNSLEAKRETCQGNRVRLRQGQHKSESLTDVWVQSND